MEAEKNNQELYVSPVYEEEESDLPDEIECQLIQKTIYINGQMRTIDFIMCNQCPRLVRHRRRATAGGAPPSSPSVKC